MNYASFEVDGVPIRYFQTEVNPEQIEWGRRTGQLLLVMRTLRGVAERACRRNGVRLLDAGVVKRVDPLEPNRLRCFYVANVGPL